ncbi:DUF1150 domain-containing protein [Hyphomicrobium sp.]|uniref:BQ00720 family protein n=1 Tax=Hyphomicrobium sp. TaxID=82 RepID=UPI002C075C8C|nr:DUF1150 domain-containing protein [Hyphomicrobium sp.]HRN89997.1 DUF1150 domain-containing protein [Hyphomicrobium sp.]HRQ25427.1 DUF1150 domain-containing protein [Hyphomicrobium sp.]
MKENTTKRLTAKQRQKAQPVATVMSDIELARLGGGQVAYIKTLSSDEALQMFPAIEDLPRGINLYALHAADGTPIALTDTRQAALSHAMDGELEIASVH